MLITLMQAYVYVRHVCIIIPSIITHLRMYVRGRGTRVEKVRLLLESL